MAVNLWAPSEQNKKDVLVEFRAGKMNYSATTKMVDADKRKGLVQLKQSPEDNLIHFIWKDRTTGTEVMNLIIFPGEATFRKVEEAKGRVYVLEWKTTDKKLFFWVQEPKDDKDKENCDNINKFINDPPQPTQNTGGLSGLGGLGALNGMDQAHLRQLLQAGGFGGMDPSQLMQMLAQGGGEGLGAVGGRRGGQQRGGQSRPASSATSSQPTAPGAAIPAPVAINRGTLQSILDGLVAQPQVSSGTSSTHESSEKKSEEKKATHELSEKKSEEKKGTPTKESEEQKSEEQDTPMTLESDEQKAEGEKKEEGGNDKKDDKTEKEGDP